MIVIGREVRLVIGLFWSGVYGRGCELVSSRGEVCLGKGGFTLEEGGDAHAVIKIQLER